MVDNKMIGVGYFDEQGSSGLVSWGVDRQRKIN